jgi:hypothetical protein
VEALSPFAIGLARKGEREFADCHDANYVRQPPAKIRLAVRIGCLPAKNGR